MRRDPLIIGGGPAGAAAAIALARAGRHPVLLEKAAGPTDKVCGDFLGIDTIQQARLLGADPASLGAASISKVRVIRGDRVAEATLPFPALGLSRRRFDSALLGQAEAAGAVVRTGQAVRRLTRDGARWTIETAGKALTAEAVFLATGKHDLRDLPRPHAEDDAVGLKNYFSLEPGAAKTLDGATELTLFPGGYAGMQFVEQERVVLCIAVRRSTFRSHGAGWAGVLGAIRESSPRFAGMIRDARPLLPRPLAVAAIPYGYRSRQSSGSGLFRIGDQAAVIPSLTGDGMAIALHSGQSAAHAWLAGTHAADAYQPMLSQTLGGQMRLAGLLQGAGMFGGTQVAAIALLHLFPGLLRYAARNTRVRTR